MTDSERLTNLRAAYTAFLVKSGVPEGTAKALVEIAEDPEGNADKLLVLRAIAAELPA